MGTWNLYFDIENEDVPENVSKIFEFMLENDEDCVQFIHSHNVLHVRK